MKQEIIKPLAVAMVMGVMPLTISSAMAVTTVDATKGATGATGATGPKGATGATGATGAQGATGLKGATGAQGAQGASGAQGTQGAQGASGAQGIQGAQGASGAQGADGATGPQGAQGASGAQGIQGASGAQGAQGAQGASGAQGTQGAQGADGATGPQGPKGDTGLSPGTSVGQTLVWNGSAWTAVTTPAYNLGDTGPDGGMVFFVDGSGEHGLEAKTSDYSLTGVVWSTAIANAASYNTTTITIGYSCSTSNAQLAPHCWHLPTKNELDYLFEQKLLLGGFANSYYWSSSEFDATSAIYENFSTGNVASTFKTGVNFLVRAVRAF